MVNTVNIQTVKKVNPRAEAMKKAWYKFSRNPLSVLGLVVVVGVIFVAVFATVLAPHPEDAGLSIHMTETFQAPGLAHLAGTDEYGRDVFSRILIGLRYSLAIGLLVLAISVPFGVLMGLLAGYYKGRLIEAIIMRFTELFMSIPPLILAMVICTMFSSKYIFAAIGIAVAWWPWYTRITYNLVTSLSNELYIVYTQLSGVKMMKIIIQEMLPNIMSPILTKMSLDMGSIIITASSMSFVGLGVQPPTPSLGEMISSGIKYLPNIWWLTIMPALMVVLVVLGFNLLGDGLSDVLSVEEK
ncbi:ABC transporter permease [Papillibacter cinnamivorans]|uniref:Peptide/nickel transport system permease protein n=1 Tax=Papillibacter cinnamivorans DSM 12816 TaxID=1122930 RepID=A0A1W2BLL5_9FIRM|nr:ABC transporter permease [Papillibacter cinnamivorans]SMC73724.1 peptide/nickel transport system permease protein [Papillibacter cinnamivorans DSM 12816]